MAEKKKAAKWVFGIAVFVLILCVILFFLRFCDGMQVPDKGGGTTTTEPAATTTADPQAQLPDNPVNFAKLKEDNPDIYAWITIPNSSIDYPVLQSLTDDWYYLSHDFNKKDSVAGAIYSEMQTSQMFTDPVTVLYGHNMKNGTMFADLHQFRKQEFFDSHPNIYIYTPGHILTYEVFAAYIYDNRHILNSFDFSDETVYAQYLADATNPKSMSAMTRHTREITVKDRIITLSTCRGNANKRYLVQGVLIDDQRTK